MFLSHPDKPFAPRRLPFFYGWALVGFSRVGVLASIPGQTIGVGVFTDYLLEALHLSRVQLSSAYAAGTIASSFLLPFAGVLLDRVGARRMAVYSALGLGGSLLAFAKMDRLAMAESAGSAALALAVVTVGFLLIRFFGQGCLTLVSRVIIGKWFNHRRGLATALSTTAVALCFNGSPQVLNALVASVGWREAYLVLAGIVGLGMTVIAALFYRDNPEECGLEMDGVRDPAWHEKMAARVAETQRDFTRGEALRTPAFWAFSLALSVQGLLITAISFHVASLGAEMGLSREDAYAIFLPMAYFSIATNVVCGWLSDRIRLKWLLFLEMGTVAMGMTGLMVLDTEHGYYMFISGFGVSQGLFGLFVTIVWPRYFGRAHLGAISGVNTSVMVFASALGPVFFSAIRSVTGSYFEVVAVSWAMPVALLVFGLFADNPQRRARPRT